MVQVSKFTPKSAHKAGLRLGKYEVIGKLSEGGMAELLLAFFQGPGGFRKFVAVKRILEALRNDEEFISLFLDEARISASLSHSNIAQVFDLGEDGNELYLALEFIEGQDLSRIVQATRERGTPPPIGFHAAVIRDLCRALHYAHHFTSTGGRQLPVIHRDISPRNVMVTYVGNTKVVDFGIARAFGHVSHTRDGKIRGSASYMSPEQIDGEALDGRSDLYSAGVLLYELITGTRLFRGKDDATTLEQVRRAAVLPPRIVRPDVPGVLSDLVMKAISQRRDDRFETGRDMANAIEEALGSELYGEDQRAALMQSYFADAMRKTGVLLDCAGHSDPAMIAQAVQEFARSRVASMGAEKDVTPTLRELPPQRTPARPGENTQPQTGSVVEKPHILAVDDSKVGRVLMERVLLSAGYRVHSASSGKEALDALAELRPDLIVLDVRMPEMDGFELCQRLRERPDLRSTPILFVSAACSLDERVRGLSVGGDDFIRKPFETAELLARVKVHLQRATLMKARG